MKLWQYTIFSLSFARKDVTILGKFTLNIFNWPENNILSKEDLLKTSNETSESLAEIFYHYLREILTNSHFFQLSIESLNNSNLIPNKDYNNDKLVSGMLQLPEHFQLVIDETELNTGKLNQKG